MDAHLKRESANRAAVHQARDAEMTRFAQLSYAADFRAATLASRVEDLEAKLAAREKRVIELEGEVELLSQGALSVNVVRLPIRP